jgi:hypothetical protein
MLTYDSNPDEFNPNSRAAADADGRLYVEFFWHYVEDKAQSEAQGRPIYRDCEFIKIQAPGDRNNIIVREMSDFDRRRFAQRYAQWKANAENNADIGTKLEQWPILSRARVEEYRYFGIRTVEHLSEANDQVATRLPGLLGDKAKAQVWLASTKDTAAAEKLNSQLKQRDDMITSMGEQIKAMQDQMAELRNAAPDGRRRSA